MTDREALAAALYRIDHPTDDETTESMGQDFDMAIAAAREHLAQLPEKCGTCGGSGSITLPSASEREYLEGLRQDQCPHCRTGKVYPAELVERIAKAIDVRSSLVGRRMGLSRDLAVAVLDALNGETP